MKQDNPPYENVVIGPMSGITSAGYRGFLGKFGKATAVTEMVSAPGLIHDPEGSSRFVRAADGQPTGIQIFGSDPVVLSEGAKMALELEPKARFIDINMGCPASKVIRTGSGSSLLSDPTLCGRIVESVKAAVDVPVTAKIRLGTDSENVTFERVVEELLKSKVDAIAIHSRTADQRYAGKADHQRISNLGNEIPIQLVVSGDIYSVDDAIRAMGVTGADSVMVARGCIGNPYLITQINAYLEDGTVLETPEISRQVEWCLELVDITVEELGEEMAAAKMRAIAPKFLSGCRYSRDYRRALTRSGATIEEMIDILERAGRDIGHLVPEPRRAANRDDSNSCRALI